MLFKRIKFPSFQLKIEGKGSGIKTNILNLKEVAEIYQIDVRCNKIS